MKLPSFCRNRASLPFRTSSDRLSMNGHFRETIRCMIRNPEIGSLTPHLKRYESRRSGAGACASLRAGLPFNEFKAEFVAVDADEAAAAKRKAGRRQQQKKLCEFQPLDRSFNGKPRARRRDVQQGDRSPPGAVDAHDVSDVTAGERNSIRFSRAPGHAVQAPDIGRSGDPGFTASSGSAIGKADAATGMMKIPPSMS